MCVLWTARAEMPRAPHVQNPWAPRMYFKNSFMQTNGNHLLVLATNLPMCLAMASFLQASLLTE